MPEPTSSPQNLDKDWPVCEGTAPSPTGMKYLFVEGLPSSPSLVPKNRGSKARCRTLVSKVRLIEGGWTSLPWSVHIGLLSFQAGGSFRLLLSEVGCDCNTRRQDVRESKLCQFQSEALRLGASTGWVLSNRGQVRPLLTMEGHAL